MRFAALIACLLLAVPTVAVGAATGMQVISPQCLKPGQDAVFVVQLRQDDGTPVAGRPVRIELEGGQRIGKGRTDRAGEAVVVAAVPPDLDPGIATVQLSSGDLVETVQLAVGAISDLLLTSDRTLYRPGQTVNLRVLALDAVSRIALEGQEVTFRIVDEQYDSLLIQPATTDAFGVASASLALADDAQTGRYLAVASSGSAETGTPLRVEDFSLPRMAIELDPSPAYLLEGGSADFECAVRYAEGSPVAGGSVMLHATTHAWHPKDDEHLQACAKLAAKGVDLSEDRYWRTCGWELSVNEFARIRIELDEEGRGSFSLEAPPYLPTIRDLEGSFLEIAAVAVDPGGHREEDAWTLALARQPLLLDLHWMHPPLAGADSRAAITVQRPDGTPARAGVEVALSDGTRVTVDTGEDGIALVDLPLSIGTHLTVTARVDADTVTRELDIEASQLTADLGLVVERPVIRAGDPLEVELRTGTPGGWAALNVLVDDTLLARQLVRLESDRQRVSIELPAHTIGLLDVVGTRNDRSVETAAIVVREGGLTVEIDAAEERVRPGGEVELRIATHDAGGEPVAAAVELGVVDHGIVVLGGAGLTGAEPAFNSVSQRDLARLSRGLAGGPLHTATLDDPAFQQRMALWMPHRSVPLVSQPVEFEYSSPRRTAPSWVRSLAVRMSRLPGACPPDRFERRWLTSSLVFGILLLAVVCWRVRRGTRTLDAAAAAVVAAALVVVPFVRWGHGPSVDRVVLQGGEPDDLPEHALSTPRRFPGIPAGAFDSRLLPGHSDALRPDMGMILEIDPHAIVVDGRTVVPLQDFVVPKDLCRGTLISPLYDHLQARRDELGLVLQSATTRRVADTVLLVASDDVPFRTLRSVMYTTAQARYPTYSMVSPGAIRPVAPPALDPISKPLWFALMFGCLVALLMTRREGLTSWVAFTAVLLLSAAQGLVRLYPLAAETRPGFPLQEGVAALQLWAIPLLLAVVALDLWRRREVPGIPITASIAAFSVLCIASGRDFGLYLDTDGHRPTLLPAIGAPGAAQEDPFAASGGTGTEAGVGEPEGVLVRNQFPDTLVYRPLLRTDAQGEASIRIPAGHQLTVWDASALASTQAGTMGLDRGQFVTAQELQVEATLPGQLTVGDRVEVPVSVYNHTDAPTEVRVALAEHAAYRREPPLQDTFTVGARSSARTFLPMVVREVGDHTVRIEARSPDQTDLLERPLTVWPEGSLPTTASAAAFAPAGSAASARLVLPPRALDGSTRASLTIYPDLRSHLAGGLDGLRRMPSGGCERVISAALCGVWLLAEERASGREGGEVAEAGRQQALTGLQSLGAYQHWNGGLRTWPSASVDPWVTAYALEGLAAIETEMGVGGERADRAAEWLLDQLVEESNPRLRASICCGLAAAIRRPAGTDAAVTSALDELVADAVASDDPWLVARVAAAAADMGNRPADVSRLADRLESLAHTDDRGGAWWSALETAAGMRGRGAAIETTARACTVLLREGRGDRALPGLLWLIGQLQEEGRWTSSHDTAMAQMAFRAYLHADGTGDGDALPRVWIGDDEIPLDPEARGATGSFEVDVTERLRAGSIEVRVESPAGSSGAVALAHARCFVPWSAADTLAGDGTLTISVRYPRAPVAVGERTVAAVQVEDRAAARRMLVVKLPVPPGFGVDRDHLRALAGRWFVERAEVEGSDIVLHVQSPSASWPARIEIPLVGVAPAAGKPLRVVVHDYGAPERRAFTRPLPVEVVRPSDVVTAATGGRSEGPRVKQIPYRPARRGWFRASSRRWTTDSRRAAMVDMESLSRELDRHSRSLQAASRRGIRVGLRRLIGTRGSSDEAVDDLLADGGSLSFDLNRALAEAHGIRTATREVDATVAVADVLVHGPGLSLDGIERVVRHGQNSLKTAYIALLARQPDARGRMELRFVVDEVGTASDVAITRDDPGSEQLTEAAVAWLERRWFDLPPEGVEVPVELTLVFGEP